MQISLTHQALVLLVIPSALGFLPTQRHHYTNVATTVQNNFQQQQQQPLSWHDDICQRPLSSTNLFMAFDSTAEESNIFDGPMALTKERDACGVGFIANTQSGGE
jgi:hypothetical protein